MPISYRKKFAAYWSALEKRLLPSYVWTSDPLTFWRERILFLICFIAAVFGPIALIPSLLLAYIEGLWIVILVDSLAYLAAVTILIARNVSFIVRALFICFILYALSVCILFILGPGGAGYIWLFGASVLISTFIGLGAAIWTLVFNTIVMLSVGIFIVYGNPVWILHEDNALGKWLVMSANFLLLNAVITVTTAFMLNGLKTALIIEQKTSKNLRESEANYRQLFDNAPAAIYQIDFRTGKFLKANAVICEYFGCSQEEVTSLSPYGLLAKESQILFLERLSKMAIGDKVPEDPEYKFVDKNGKSRWLKLNSKNIYDSEGLSGADVVAHDVTDRKQAENDLRKSEEEFRSLAESMPQIVWVTRKDGWNIYFNQQWVDYTGLTLEESYGHGWNTPFHPDDKQRAWDDWQNATKNNSIYSIECRLRRADGVYHWWLIRGVPLCDETGEIIKWFGTCTDIDGIKNTEKQLLDTLDSLRRAVSTTIQVMVSTIEARDPYTAGHQLRTANLVRAIATEMGLAQDKIEGLRMAGSIHDIGKISIPSEILTKPTKLSELEFSLIKEHAQIAYEMLKDVESPWPLAQIVYQHHERMDGSGYPRHLKGKDILMEARIMAVADVVEAMSSHRPYRPSLGLNSALAEIENNKETLYDAEVVDACLKLFREKGFKLEGALC